MNKLSLLCTILSISWSEKEIESPNAITFGRPYFCCLGVRTNSEPKGIGGRARGAVALGGTFGVEAL